MAAEAFNRNSFWCSGDNFFGGFSFLLKLVTLNSLNRGDRTVDRSLGRLDDDELFDVTPICLRSMLPNFSVAGCTGIKGAVVELLTV